MMLDHAQCYRAIVAKDVRFDGHFFTGVKTTGIYCRPVCSARVPKATNVTFYPSAAAAHEAGFRPCLKCRPETAPKSPAWAGTSAVVARGLRLIDDGALDEGTVSALANRLGIGDRHLRRLFLTHIGATPIAVAQTRRILLAKQLLHETQLSMSDVALASGFGSIRRFNEVFQALFARPPIALRRSVQTPAVRTRGEEIVLKLRFRPPYDWAAARAFLTLRLYQGIEAFIGDDYCRSFRIDGYCGLVFVGPGGPDWLKVRVICANLAVLPKVIARVRRCFDLDCDPATIGAHLSEDDLLCPLVALRPGLRVLQSWSLYEGLVRTILGQQVTVKAAIALGNQFVGTLGVPLSSRLCGNSPITHIFPEATRCEHEAFAFLRMPKARQRTLSNVSCALANEKDTEVLDVGDVRQRLSAIAGIGPWTLDYLALRVLSDPDAFPHSDVAILRAYAREREALGICEPLEDYGQRWKPWRAYAAQHLWACA